MMIKESDLRRSDDRNDALAGTATPQDEGKTHKSRI